MAQESFDNPPSGSNPLERDDQILEQKPDMAKASQKVALDLDDAPFLADVPSEKPAHPPPETSASSSATADAEPAGDVLGISRKKLVPVFAGLILLLAAGGVAFWLTRPGPVPDLPPVPSPSQEVMTLKTDEHYVELAPFLVAFDQDKEILFLTLQLSLVTDDPASAFEIDQKTIVLRDAVYYFLNNRPLPTVKRVEAAEMLKEDLLSIFNQHLSRPLKEVLIEEYLVQ